MKVISGKGSEDIMKKAFCVLAAVLTLVLCGCQDDKAAGDPEYGEDISKAQAISVISSV